MFHLLKKYHLLFVSILSFFCIEISAQWDKYPTYSAYTAYMSKWQADFPQLAKVHDLGPSENGKHRIYAIKISDTVAQREAEPKYFQVASLSYRPVPYMFTLHMIDTLLSSYGKDQRITDLINGAELWFCPLPDPDAMYYSGDNFIYQPGVQNPFDYSIGRNWPCPCMEGNHKYYGLYVKRYAETAAIMKLDTTVRFNLHAYLEGGTEVAFWPYGADSSAKVCDEEWYIWAAQRYVNRVHIDCGNNGYMTATGGDGVGNVAKELYPCHGTRLDYCSRFAQVKGLWLQITVVRQPSEPELLKYWTWNKEALFQYFELLNTGIQGIVTDAVTKKPIHNVNITAANHDYDSADVSTDSTGFYVRFIEKGTYALTFSHPDYHDKTIPDITVDNYEVKRILNVELDYNTGIENAMIAAGKHISIIPTSKSITILFHTGMKDKLDVAVYDMKGTFLFFVHDVYPQSGACTLHWDSDRYGSGMYVLKIRTNGSTITKRVTIIR